MKKRLTRIAPFKLGLASAVSFVLVGLVLALGVCLLSLVTDSRSYHAYTQMDVTPLAPPATSGSPSVPANAPVVAAGGYPHADFAGSTVVHLAPNDFTFGDSPMMLLLFPLIWGVVGFLSGVTGSFAFNLTARWTGGLEVNVEDITAASR